VGCQHHVRPQLRFAVEEQLQQQHVAQRIRADALAQHEAIVAVQDLDGGYPGLGQHQLGPRKVLDLAPESPTVGDDEAHVPDLRNVGPRIIDLIEDPLTDGEPQARGTQGTAHHVLGARRPGGRNSGVPEGVRSAVR